MQQNKRKRQPHQDVSYLRKQADNYINQHQIIELFEDLTTKLCYQQIPQDKIDQFIINELKNKQQHGFSTGIFTAEEIENVFNLFDLKNEKFITKRGCIEALKVLSSSQYQNDQIEYNSVKIPEKVDLKQFTRLCESISGIRDSKPSN